MMLVLVKYEGIRLHECASRKLMFVQTHFFVSSFTSSGEVRSFAHIYDISFLIFTVPRCLLVLGT